MGSRTALWLPTELRDEQTPEPITRTQAKVMYRRMGQQRGGPCHTSAHWKQSNVYCAYTELADSGRRVGVNSAGGQANLSGHYGAWSVRGKGLKMGE